MKGQIYCANALRDVSHCGNSRSVNRELPIAKFLRRHCDGCGERPSPRRSSINCLRHLARRRSGPRIPLRH